MDLNNRRTGEHATKPRALGLLGHSVYCSTLNPPLHWSSWKTPKRWRTCSSCFLWGFVESTSAVLEIQVHNVRKCTPPFLQSYKIHKVLKTIFQQVSCTKAFLSLNTCTIKTHKNSVKSRIWKGHTFLGPKRALFVAKLDAEGTLFCGTAAFCRTQHMQYFNPW